MALTTAQKAAEDAAGKRVTVSLSQSAYEDLEGLAKEQGLTLSELLRKSIALNKWFTEAQKEGNVLVERKGKIREVVKL